VLYWLLAALPLDSGGPWRLHYWGATPDAVEVRDTPALSVIGRESVRLDDGTTYACWIVSAQGSAGEYRMWVTQTAPYLVRQEVHNASEDPIRVIDLKRVR